MIKNILTYKKLEDNKGYEYSIPYLDKIKYIYVDEKLPDGDIGIYNCNGICYGKIKVEGKNFVSLNIFLYGKIMAKKNGDSLDYRRDNCVDFSMGDFNVSQRKYKNSTGFIGVKKLINGFTFSYQRNGKIFRSKEKFLTALKAYQAREEVIKSLKK